MKDILFYTGISKAKIRSDKTHASVDSIRFVVEQILVPIFFCAKQTSVVNRNNSFDVGCNEEDELKDPFGRIGGSSN